jgi:LemA protein
MSTRNIVLLGILALLLFAGFNACSSRNSMVVKQEGTTAQWQQVEVAYQARMDKTKNLLEIVKGASNFEQKTLTDIVEARAKVGSIKIDPTNITPEKLKEFQAAQDNLGGAIGRLMVISEQYPTLQSLQGWRDFQTQYEGMENRISTERRKFNEVVQDYNTYIRLFPRNIWAGIFNFVTKPYFDSKPGSEDAPDIKDMMK